MTIKEKLENKSSRELTFMLKFANSDDFKGTEEQRVLLNKTISEIQNERKEKYSKNYKAVKKNAELAEIFMDI